MNVEKIVGEYGNMLFKLCMVLLCNEQDAQDVVQETLIRYMEHAPAFQGKEHEKAWLMKVAANQCRDVYRGRMRHPVAELTEISQYCEMPEQSQVLEEVMKLPGKLKTVIYLYYIEGYKTTEIADLMGTTKNTVRKRLQRGRERLKISLKEK